MGGANSVDRPGTHLNPQANVHSDSIVRSSTSSLSGEVVADEANTRMREVSSAPSIFWHENEQGDQLHQRAVRYIYTVSTKNRPPKHVLKSSKLARFAQLQFNSMNRYVYFQ